MPTPMSNTQTETLKQEHKAASTSPGWSRRHTPRAQPRKGPLKNEFRIRESRMGVGLKGPNTNEFAGFYNLVIIALIMVVTVTELRSIIIQGTLVGFNEMKVMFERFDLIPTWLGLVCASYNTFFIIYAVAHLGLSNSTAKLLHTVFLSLIWIGSMGNIIMADFPVVQRIFLLLETCVLVMKMHSYYVTNMEMRTMSKDEQHRHTLKNEALVREAHSEDDGELEDKKDRKLLQWPQNVTLGNYTDFLLVPTLVYEMEYPRTTKVRWSFVMEKFVVFIGLFTVIHVMVQTYFLPYLIASVEGKITVVDAVSQLLVPTMLCYLLLFYIVFEVFCIGFAEMTCFADREFYSDWWNSTTFEEFARKWNKPVHEWLLRHIYLESMTKYKVSSSNAAVITFLFSAVFHEFFMGMVFKVYQPWLFCFQMFQLPLIFLARNKYVKGKRLGNMLFWAGMMVGPPMICLLYTRAYWLRHIIVA
eukprot:TRINITY_DN7530_c0_g1_i1.p1 TRINITY_DN7530_c0_g1~~TRINITY_DN7530_c0_g1_i1.p1  ORF type:complete len:473 (-),score=89.62 TRINITY_DN7530_c0_g1_i1:50-1468(-)